MDFHIAMTAEVDSMKHEPTDKDIEIVAYHEAGHAVMTWALKVGLKQIYVGDFQGMVTGEAIPPYFDPEFMSESEWTRVKKKALILLAGERAERAYNELHELDCDEFLSAHDGRELIELLGKFGEHECPPIDLSETTLKAEADKLVVYHWNQIEALARELVKRVSLDIRVMSGNDAIQIIESIKLP